MGAPATKFIRYPHKYTSAYLNCHPQNAGKEGSSSLLVKPTLKKRKDEPKERQKRQQRGLTSLQNKL
jgi:hypothetical protein